MTFIISPYIASTLFTLFIAIGLLSTRALNPLCARILGAIYLLFFVQHLLAVIVFSDLYPQAAVLRGILAMLLGPALYLYFNSVLASEKFKLKQFWFHLLPMPIMASTMFSAYGFVTDVLIVGSFLGYFSFTLFSYLKQRSNRSSIKQPNKLALRWLGLISWVMLVNLFVEVGIIFELLSGISVRESLSLKMGSLFFLGFNTFALFLILTRAPLLEWMYELKELSIHISTRPTLSDKHLQAIFTRWEELVTMKELFLSEHGITVSRAARQLGIPSRHLSQAINTIYGASFSQYLNEKRVERVKELLGQNTRMSITEVI